MIEIINKLVLASSKEDSLCWAIDRMGVFSVKSLCAMLMMQIFGEEESHVPKYLVKIILPKVSLFMWMARRNIIAT